MVFIETHRLELRSWEADDWKRFKPIATDSEVMRYIGHGELWSDERTKQFVTGSIRRFRESGYCLWPLMFKKNQDLIGFCGLTLLNEPDEIEIGWRLARAYWGMGLATEAAEAVMKYGFEKLKLDRIVAIAQPPNKRSIRVMEKIGMEFIKMTKDRNGIDVVYYSKQKPSIS